MEDTDRAVHRGGVHSVPFVPDPKVLGALDPKIGSIFPKKKIKYEYLIF